MQDIHQQDGGQESKVIFLLLVSGCLAAFAILGSTGSLLDGVVKGEKWMQWFRSMHVLNRSSACLACPAPGRRVNGWIGNRWIWIGYGFMWVLCRIVLWMDGMDLTNWWWDLHCSAGQWYLEVWFRSFGVTCGIWIGDDEMDDG